MDSLKSVRDGAIGGLIAAATLIVLFFFYDLIRGDALGTPAFLAGSLLGRGDAVPTMALVASYTVIHFLAFAALGALAGVLFDIADVPRNVLFGAAYGLFAASLGFYTSLTITGSDVLRAPAWAAVFFGNALAGVIIVSYLAMRGGDTEGSVIARALGSKVVKDGVIVGLIGASVVALWFLIVDMITIQPLFTPAALGSLLLGGASGITDIDTTVTVVIGYTIFHFATFIVLGVVLSALVTQAERFPPFVFALVILFIVFETFFIAVVAMLGTWVLDLLAWWSVLVGNLLAAVAMGAYLWRAHPRLRKELAGGALWAES